MPVYYSVPLDFLPPEEPDFTKLHIYESDNPETGFAEIEVVTDIGQYPDYITRWVTDKANHTNDWFSIQWEDAKGSLTEMSAAVQGGTRTLVGEIVERVQQRDAEGRIDPNVIAQNAEAVIQFIYKVDPYTLMEEDVDYTERNALADLTMVAVKFEEIIDRSTDPYGYTAGMVSESSLDMKNAIDALTKMESRALKRLGIGGSLIGHIQDPFSLTPGTSIFTLAGLKTTFDSSRLLSVSAILTEVIKQEDLA